MQKRSENTRSPESSNSVPPQLPRGRSQNSQDKSHSPGEEKSGSQAYVPHDLHSVVHYGSRNNLTLLIASKQKIQGLK